MISEDYMDPYMMSIINVNHLLINLLALRVSNLNYELDEALGEHTHYLQKQQTIH